MIDDDNQCGYTADAIHCFENSLTWHFPYCAARTYMNVFVNINGSGFSIQLVSPPLRRHPNILSHSTRQRVNAGLLIHALLTQILKPTETRLHCTHLPPRFVGATGIIRPRSAVLQGHNQTLGTACGRYRNGRGRIIPRSHQGRTCRSWWPLQFQSWPRCIEPDNRTGRPPPAARLLEYIGSLPNNLGIEEMTC
jgi:hypothetical protein